MTTKAGHDDSNKEVSFQRLHRLRKLVHRPAQNDPVKTAQSNFAFEGIESLRLEEVYRGLERHLFGQPHAKRDRSLPLPMVDMDRAVHLR